jgi:hypothetical protein
VCSGLINQPERSTILSATDGRPHLLGAGTWIGGHDFVYGLLHRCSVPLRGACYRLGQTAENELVRLGVHEIEYQRKTASVDGPS